MYPLLKKPRKIIEYPGSAGIIREIGNTFFLKQINETASEIFQLCDGNNNINDISTLLSKKYNQPFKETFNIVKEFINLSSLNKDIDLINTAEYKEIKVTGSKKFWIPTVITIEITYKCPLFCKHCYRECSMKRTESISLDLIKKISLEMKSQGILYVQLTGGDPLYHPQFEEIVQEFTKNEIVVTILTSGFYRNEKIFDFFEENKKQIAGIQVSIDGLNNQHNSIRGRSNAYKRSINFISRLSDIGYNIDVVTTLINQDKEEVFELSRKLKDVGVKRHRLSVLIDAGRSLKNGFNSDIQKKCIVDEWISELSHSVEDENFKVQLEEDHNFHSQNHCGAGSRLIRIDPDGFVHPCLMIDYPIYSLTQGTIVEYSSKYSNKFNSIGMPNKENCNDCPLSDNCKGCIAEGVINHKQIDCSWYHTEWEETKYF